VRPRWDFAIPLCSSRSFGSRSHLFRAALSVCAGCSRKLDLVVDPLVNLNKLKLLATATVAGRKVRDKDSFNFHR